MLAGWLAGHWQKKSLNLSHRQERKEILESIKFVDYVIIFDESTPKKLIEYITPNLLKSMEFIIHISSNDNKHIITYFVYKIHAILANNQTKI